MNCHLLGFLFGGILLALLVLRHRQSITAASPAWPKGLGRAWAEAARRLQMAGLDAAHIAAFREITDQLDRGDAWLLVESIESTAKVVALVVRMRGEPRPSCTAHRRDGGGCHDPQ